MGNPYYEELKERFDATAMELARLDLDVIQTESTLAHCEKFSFSWQQQFELFKALKHKQALTQIKLANLAVDLDKEKARIGL